MTDMRCPACGCVFSVGVAAQLAQPESHLEEVPPVLPPAVDAPATVVAPPRLVRKIIHKQPAKPKAKARAKTGKKK